MRGGTDVEPSEKRVQNGYAPVGCTTHKTVIVRNERHFTVTPVIGKNLTGLGGSASF